ncbi:RluA family pseudouridine synthase [Ohtaekwangia koreensis]|uniref:23S rRNA pseudouridine955/2504/2580 synthase n=1 Tax=Ohtaekwangia koreensis TaxID=688867 RepID=A0A1T5IQS3_9BACT|nr:RluA family pseudouridine synthase [Ohtaekwangia koreensis]SKC41348.1 23S rRNA pseudouridine955/2504/2580 synthase [Ohtaekwangia koreensis]
MKNSSINLEDLILFEDDDFILINKPPYVSTLEDRHEKVNLLGLARDYISTAQVCHRLDKDTSGVLAIAKNPEAYRHMSLQFEKREVTKVYHAVVDGIHNFKDDLVDLPILKQDDGVVKISKREGKSAQTYFTSLKSYKLHTLVECRPVTGRMHQIRIHLSTLKASITGDELYGGKPFFLSSVKRGFNLKKETEEQPIMRRMALHAYALTFADLKGDKKTVEAPYPKDIQALIKQLENNS